jgi:CMP-N,N'-diacetyllegionaminic acid synthase
LRAIGIVTARGGSKGVPRKNIRSLGGKPLLAWTAEAARGAKRLTRTILTTDDAEIAEVGRQLGLDVPFMRPQELALDTTPTLPVMQHAVAALEATGDRYDTVVLLQPTSPLRTSKLIDDCIDLFEREQADSVVTVLPVPSEYNPHWVYFQRDGGELHIATGETSPIGRRQDLPMALHREGSVFVVRRDVLMEQNSLYGERMLGQLVDASSTIDIDTVEDWERAEALLSRS